MSPHEEIAIIVKTCAYVFRVPETSLVRKERGSLDVAIARQVAMWFCCIGTKLDRRLIGRAFGGRTAKTVNSAFSNIPNRCRNCPEMKAKVRAVQEHLNVASV